MLLLPVLFFAQNVGIGTSTPDPSAQLHIEDNTRGILVPRLTTVQRNAISNPADGLLIYNVDCQTFEFWEGTAWRRLEPIHSIKQKFFYTGSVQTVTVPCEASQAIIKVWGAGGGGGGADVCSSDPNSGGKGGGGTYATVTVAVTPGHVLGIYVGQGGAAGGSCGTGTGGGVGGWGYGGGGKGGNAGNSGFSGGGGGGGGSSAVINQTTNTLLVGAGGGGGGGGGGLYNPCYGGNGGGGGRMVRPPVVREVSQVVVLLLRGLRV